MHSSRRKGSYTITRALEARLVTGIKRLKLVVGSLEKTVADLEAVRRPVAARPAKRGLRKPPGEAGEGA